MANYYAQARSNYFAVKDETAFRAWAKELGLGVINEDKPFVDPAIDPKFGITTWNTGDSGGWPSYIYDEETDEDIEVDLYAQLATHLAEGEVAVLIEIGSEKIKYLTGSAVAVNSSGDCCSVNLDGIYDLAETLGPNVTRAEY